MDVEVISNVFFNYLIILGAGATMRHVENLRIQSIQQQSDKELMA